MGEPRFVYCFDKRRVRNPPAPVLSEYLGLNLLVSFLEMRKKFDDGEDPLDAESQQGGGGNPFHRSWNSWQGFNPFSSGGPFRFKFHFN